MTKPGCCFQILILGAVVTQVSAEELGEGKPLSQYTDMLLPAVTVIGTTPLSSARLTMDKVSGNIQAAQSEDIDRHESLDLTDFMNRSLSSVSTNSVLGNPYQADVNYRGFTASPVLGTPVGVSVYQDGVRVNEAFGDTVNWDLIPRAAIANMELVPGSNPLFGLNTLGGALSIRTKSGLSHPGTRGQLYGGSFGRKSAEMEHGGSHGNFDWFFAGNLFEEDGWRRHSPSTVKQGFAKVGWENENTDLDLSYTYAENKLTGNGAAPVSLLAQDPAAVYAYPETTRPRMHFLNLAISHLFSKQWMLSGNAYYRHNDIGVHAGDVELELASDGDFDRQPVVNTTLTRQEGVGGAFQLSYLGQLFGLDNQATAGASYDSGDTDFKQWRQNGLLTNSRGVVGNGPIGLRTRLDAANHYYGVYLTDTLSITPWLHLTASGRWNRAEITLKGVGADNEGERESLDGKHEFNRLNPAVGFTLQPFKALDKENAFKELTFFANYNEGFRVPTPVELTCADPAAPCSLPTNFVSDPALKPIVAQTWETGLRGNWNPYLDWNIAWFRTALSNDILFINAAGTTTRGYFQNVGNTLREGLELGLRGRVDELSWYFNYSYLDATYQTDITLHNAVGPVAVRSGNQIPSLPPHMLKLGADYELLKGWFVGGNLLYSAGQYLRGDDGNQYQKLADYAVVNLNSHYDISKNVQIFALANNVFDDKYQTFGLINRNAYTNPSGKTEAFVTPGAPLSGWAGVRVRFN